MIQEEKQILLVDLCARLPYECKYTASKGITHWHKLTLSTGTIDKIIDDYYDEIKPYLRPMSSMTEEEYTKYRTMQGRNCDYGEATICVSKSLYSGLLYDDNEPVKITVYYPNPVIQDWLNKKMFDYRGLIPMGLALEAPEEMYK